MDGILPTRKEEQEPLLLKLYLNPFSDYYLCLP